MSNYIRRVAETHLVVTGSHEGAIGSREVTTGLNRVVSTIFRLAKDGVLLNWRYCSTKLELPTDTTTLLLSECSDFDASIANSFSYNIFRKLGIKSFSI